MIGEESITDFLLLHLYRNHQQEVTIKKFNKQNEEPKTGADWEWWFVSGNQSFGMRVQAKRLKTDTLNYVKLGKKVGATKTMQVDRLINSAKRNQCFPVYCFYNYWATSSFVPKQRCPHLMPFTCLYGCAVADAREVRLLVKAKKRSLVAFAPHLWPWMCLVCCTNQPSNNSSLAERVRAFAVNLARDKTEVPDVRTSPPVYVSALIGKSLETNVDTALPDKDVAGILVIQERKEEG